LKSGQPKEAVLGDWYRCDHTYERAEQHNDSNPMECWAGKEVVGLPAVNELCLRLRRFSNAMFRKCQHIHKTYDVSSPKNREIIRNGGERGKQRQSTKKRTDYSETKFGPSGTEKRHG
jgi:hypothetical protein